MTRGQAVFYGNGSRYTTLTVIGQATSYPNLQAALAATSTTDASAPVSSDITLTTT
jgi:hypothetical protein